jgi:HEAT repeat protein
VTETALDRPAHLALRLAAEPDVRRRYRLRAQLFGSAWTPEVLVAVWTGLLDDPGHVRRARAAFLLAKLGPAAGPAAGALAANVADPSVFTDARWAAAFALERIGPPASPVLPGLLHVLTDDHDREVRAQLAIAIGAIGPDRASIDALARALGDGDPHVREAAATALGGAGPAAGGAYEALARLANHDPFRRVRVAASDATARVGGASVEPADEVAGGTEIGSEVVEIVERLRVGDARSRGENSWKAGILGPEAKLAVPVLLSQLETDVDHDARWGAAWALGRIGDPEAQRALSRALAGDEDPDVRAKAAEALGELGRLELSAYEALRRARNDDDREVREYAAAALARLHAEDR